MKNLAVLIAPCRTSRGMGTLRQLPVRSVVQCDSFPTCPRTFENARARYRRFDAAACPTVAARYILTILSISN